MHLAAAHHMFLTDTSCDRHEVREVKLGNKIVWPIYSIASTCYEMWFGANGEVSRGIAVTTLVGHAKAEGDDTVLRTIHLTMNTSSDTDVVITKVNPQADPDNRIHVSGYTSGSGELVVTFAAENLGTTEYSDLTVTFQVYWPSKDLSIYIVAHQEANTSEDVLGYTLTTSLGGLEFTGETPETMVSDRTVSVLGGRVDVTALRRYDEYGPATIWTSGAVEGGTKIGSSSRMVGVTRVVCSGGVPTMTDSIYFGDNRHNEEGLTYTVVAYYRDLADPQEFASPETTVDQDGDTYTVVEEAVEGSYEAHLDIINSQNLTPAGTVGNCHLEFSTIHEVDIFKAWDSDGARTKTGRRTENDLYRIDVNQIGNYFSTDANWNITHDSMGAPGCDISDLRTVDSVTFVLHNLGDPSHEAQATRTITIENNRTTTVANIFSLTSVHPTDIPIIGEGDDVPLDYTSVNRTTYTYDSGAVFNSDNPLGADLVITPQTAGTVSPSAIGGIDSATLTVDANPSYTESRSLTVSMYYMSNVVASLTFGQEPQPWPLSHYIGFGDSPTATSRTTTVYNTYHLALRVNMTAVVTEQATEQIVARQDWVGDVPANGYYIINDFLPYGYGYDVEYVINFVDLA